MKIKFIKEYVAVDPVPTSGIIHRYRVGETEEITPYAAQWLIDNGFAKEVIESGWWKPRFDEKYYSVDSCGEACAQSWLNDELDEHLYSVGNVFKTKNAAERYRDYLKAIATVRQDDGFMRKNGGGFGWPVIEYKANNPGVDDIAGRQHAGEFYFDTREHALNSAMNHTREWQTIMNYDWSRE